jgi:Domain of unknown function (DUF4384)
MRLPLILALALAVAAAPAVAQETIRNRAVRIIEGGPSPVEPVAPAMDAPAIPEAEARADNASGLAVEVLPGTEIAVGSPMAIKVTTEKNGYLVVVDVDSSGKLTQIFPNTLSLAAPQGSVANANLITRGKPRLIPDAKENANFQFVASPPLGVGMVVAILSDKPVQVIDLPDVPAMMAGRLPALDYVRDNTRSLQILPATDSGKIERPAWSFATKFYVIK